MKICGQRRTYCTEKTEALLVACKELDVEVSAERTEYMFMPCEQNTG